MDLARIAAALADPMRVAIVELMAKAGCQTGCCAGGAGVCVCELVEHLRISQPRASYHLKILREAGLVTEWPRGKWTFYKVNAPRIAAFCQALSEAAGVQRGVQDGPEQQ